MVSTEAGVAITVAILMVLAGLTYLVWNAIETNRRAHETEGELKMRLARAQSDVDNLKAQQVKPSTVTYAPQVPYGIPAYPFGPYDGGYWGNWGNVYRRHRRWRH